MIQTNIRHTAALRVAHWLTAAVVAALSVLGLWMTSRSGANLWDALTNTLYAWHKALGFTALLLVVLRLIIRSRSQSIPYPDDTPNSQFQLVRLVHISLYLLLIAVPLFGWAGITAFPALITVGGYHLPAMPGIPVDQALAKQLLGIHGTLAILLIVLALGHILAALKHLLIDKDGIFNRIWFGKSP